jgi:hypothetical protein
VKKAQGYGFEERRKKNLTLVSMCFPRKTRSEKWVVPTSSSSFSAFSKERRKVTGGGGGDGRGRGRMGYI